MLTGALRLAASSLAANRLLAAAQGIGILAALTLIIAVPLVQTDAAERGLRVAVQSRGQGANVEIQRNDIRDPSGYDGFESRTSAQVSRDAGWFLSRSVQYAGTPPLTPFKVNGVLVTPEGVSPEAAYYDQVLSHIRVESGLWPEGTKDASGHYGIAITQFASETLGIKLGDRYCVYYIRRPRRLDPNAPVPESWCSVVKATWAPIQSLDPYWAGNVPDLALLLNRDSFFQIAQLMPTANVRVGQSWTPRLSAIHESNYRAVADVIRTLRGRYGVAGNATFISSLDSAVENYQRDLLASQLTGNFVAMGLLAVAIYGIAFLTGHFSHSQLRSVALLRSRGWSRMQVAGWLILQIALLTTASAPVAVLVAVVAEHLAGLAGSASISADWSQLISVIPAVAVALAASAVVVTAIAISTCAGPLSEARLAQSRVQISWWTRRGADLVVGGIGLVLLMWTHWASPDIAAGDPLQLLLPIVGTAVIAGALLRLIPVGARLLWRAGSIASELSATNLLRQADSHARLVLLLFVSTAIGLFASTYIASDHRNAVDRADYAAGADLLVRYDRVGAPAIGPSLDRLPSVQKYSLAFRAEGRPGQQSTDVTVLGIDASMADVAWSRPGLSPAPLRDIELQLAASDPDGLPLPIGADQLAVTVHSTGLDAELWSRLSDAAGHLFDLDLGPLAQADWTSPSVPLPLAAVRPVRLRGLRVITTLGPRTGGAVALADISAGGRTLAAFERPNGWWRVYEGPSLLQAAIEPSDIATVDGRLAAVLPVQLANGTLDVEPPASANPIPVVMSRQTLSTYGLRLGQSFPLHMDTVDVQLTPILGIDYFPTLYPGEGDFVLAPWPALLSRLAQGGGYSPFPNEAWVKATGPLPNLARQLKEDSSVVSVSNRQTLESIALTNPLRVSLDATLTMGFGAAAVISITAFVFHFLILVRGRAEQYAVLRANGLSSRVLGLSIAQEQMALLAIGIAGGIALAALLSWAALPLLRVGVMPEELIPPTALTIDWRSAAGATALVILAGAVAGRLIASVASRIDVVGELRRMG